MREDISVWIYLCSLCSCLTVITNEKITVLLIIINDYTYLEIGLPVLHTVTRLGFF